MALGPNNLFNGGAQLSGALAGVAATDVGLRQYMLRVYNYMASGLLLTGIVAYGGVQIPAVMDMLYAPAPGGGLQPTMFAYVVMFAPLAFMLVLSFGIQRMKASTAQTIFWVFAAVMGLSLTNIFLVYTGASIARVFFISAATFASMSLYGYTTKRDLSRFGSFLMMGLIGIVIASLVNMFIQSTAMQFVISVIGVLVFVGLTAHDTQNIKLMYAEADGAEAMQKKAIMGALHLYLDFLNLFLMLLHLFGNRR
ncbi:MAG: Bax inhibitor-1/YccA family protein [Rhodospirillales bacterium]|nr:Bax inhibitor-1/YccA family protein [Rhodospirillales bacterium]